MQAWHQAWLAEAYRVLAPGGIIKAFSATRTWHRLAMAMELVGFKEIHSEAWAYASGFPKSLNLAKALDKMVGAEPIDLGVSPNWRDSNRDRDREKFGSMENAGRVTAPSSSAAQEFAGYGTALKPAFEPFICGIKPLDEGKL